MSDLDKRIRALSTKPRYVEKLKVEDVIEALAPRPTPVAISKQDLRRQAEAAIAGFKGAITKLQAVDPAERERERLEARQARKSARRRPHEGGGSD